MVDPSYNGNYSGVVVSGNTIKGVGTGFFNLGIGIGSKVWSNPHDGTYSGPATIEDNTFIGNIGFSIVVNGWSGGLTVSLAPRFNIPKQGSFPPQPQLTYLLPRPLICIHPKVRY